MSYVAHNVQNEFVEFIGGFVIETETSVGRKPPFLTRGAHLAMYIQLARDVFNASFDRRSNEGHKGLLEDGAKRMIDTFSEMFLRDGGAYMDWHRKEMVLRMILAQVDHTPYPFQCVVDFELRERRGDAFPARYYREPWAGDFGSDGYGEEHPMRTFARFLDYLDDIKGVDMDEYKANLQQKRHIISWRRVGLCFVPQEKWQPRFRYPASLSQALEEHRGKS